MISPDFLAIGLCYNPALFLENTIFVHKRSCLRNQDKNDTGINNKSFLSTQFMESQTLTLGATIATLWIPIKFLLIDTSVNC